MATAAHKPEDKNVFYSAVLNKGVLVMLWTKWSLKARDIDVFVLCRLYSGLFSDSAIKLRGEKNKIIFNYFLIEVSFLYILVSC